MGLPGKKGQIMIEGGASMRREWREDCKKQARLLLVALLRRVGERRLRQGAALNARELARLDRWITEQAVALMRRREEERPESVSYRFCS